MKYFNLHTLQGMDPIHDVAEHGLRLIEDYKELITNQEDQKQFLLQQITIKTSLTQKRVLLSRQSEVYGKRGYVAMTCGSTHVRA